MKIFINRYEFPVPFYYFKENMSTVFYFVIDYHFLLLKLLIASLVIGYLFGSIPVAYLYSKAHGVNILEVGSGNPGSTNVGRALGKMHGRIVFFLDVLKIIIPVALINYLFYYTFYLKIGIIYPDSALKFFRDFIAIYTGLGGVLGHNFPLFLNFKGGKGVSCTMGAIFCFSIPYSLFLFLVYKIVTKVTRYVSVGSLTAATVLLVSSIILAIFDIYPFHYNYPFIDLSGIGVLLIPGIFVMWALAFIRHKKNIARLLNGTENKIKK